MKTTFLALALSLLVMMPSFVSASGGKLSPDTLATVPTGEEPVTEEEFIIGLDENFPFQEKVYIHIYDMNENPLVDGAFSRKDIKENKALKDLLRKSVRFLNVDRHYYYFLIED